jgi:GNAT superfamily N-acetyltransferase
MPGSEQELLHARAISAVDTLRLRQEVLRPGRPTSECRFPGDEDESTVHAGTIRGGAIVSIASMYLEDRPAGAPGGAPASHDSYPDGTAWRLRGMATEPELRGAGAGRLALDLCIAHAADRGGSVAWCNARIEAVGFYERLGWAVVGGDVFDIPTVGPHVVMERPLP